MTQSLTERMRAQERLHTLYGILERQRQVHAALTEVMQTPQDPSDDQGDRALSLQRKVAREMIYTCEAIWEWSGPEQKAQNR